MIKRKNTNIKSGALALFILCLSAKTLGADLMQVYQQSLTSDAAFREAQATWLAAREALPISEAALLPQLSAVGSLTRSRIGLKNATNPGNNYYDNNNAYGLTLTQPIFNYTNWMTVASASNTVKQAQATFNAAAQNLMLRVATAYFNVLKAEDILRFTQAEKRAIGQELDQTKRRYEVGLIPITGLNEAQAKYDAMVAQEIVAQKSLTDQREKLREITTINYDSLSTLVTKLPLVMPDPLDMEQWVGIAEKQNYGLQAARYGALAAKRNIAVKMGGEFPTLNAVGGYNYNRDSDYLNTGSSRTRTMSGGLSLNVPILQGGLVIAQTQQARRLYDQALATEDKTHNQLTSNTRQAYTAVVADIEKIKADNQEIIANVSKLDSTQAAYEAGTRTMVDVLNAQADLYNSQKVHASDQYDYLIQTLTLKQLAGTISPQDLEQINYWLQQPKEVAESKPAAKVMVKAAKNKRAKVHKITSKAVANYYVLQFTADKTQSQLIQSLQQYQLKHKDACTYSGAENNVMLCGHYLSLADAKAAQKKVPSMLSKMQIKIIPSGKKAAAAPAVEEGMVDEGSLR